MLPIVTPEEMAAIDAAAPVTSEVLIERAGAAVAWAALRMLGGGYGRTVNVICGKGNNGADGRVAARHLAARGVRVRVIDVPCPQVLPESDLVIDAAYGTGFHGTWSPPDVGDTPVLAVDLPSGVDGLTGDISGEVLAAAHTVTFAALKPGLLMPPGSVLAGELELADIGLDVRSARANLVQSSDVAEWWPERDEYSHKWRSAVRVVAGSSTMTGAPRLVAHAAMRSGAGMVSLSVPGMTLGDAPIEIVQRPLPSTAWADAALGSLERFHSIVVGPGLGRADDTGVNIRKLVLEAPLPMVIDGDGLFALGWSSEGATALLRRRTPPTVLTPHDGEYTLLKGGPPGLDRMVAARRLAADSGCTVLLKGAATIVADPDGQALVVTSGDSRLATAGTGDVLSGIIGALLAAGVKPLHAAAAGAWVHGQAGRRGARHGLVASDLPDLIPAVLEELL
ncbi:MAG: ADP-dependent NAD(P)H-hydrate dehydratase / NAD(P)H-hydrate epimerase [Ilumatobacteraceae bacterium]|nr:ADP-dependent NAD(P)H-hydrate dehydratase / NAD(P)H-hydrate epimerase [Ilumatobacteraceae bacterium]